MSGREITGRQVFAVTAGAFAIIIGVNMVLAWKAVATFPGLEVKNSYVASQSFDADRAAQLALGWAVALKSEDGRLVLSFRDANGRPVAPKITAATLGRATHVNDDRTPVFVFDGADFVADAELAPGYWNLRLKAEAADGTPFRQRIELLVRPGA